MIDVITEYAAPTANGVFEDDVCEIIEYKDEKWCGWAAIKFAHVGPHDWRYGISCSTGDNGQMFWPTMKSQSFKSYQEAMDDAIKRLIRLYLIFELEEEQSYEKVVAWLQSLSQPSPV